MKLWHISQDQNNGYDTYDSAVVAAETEEQARDILPCSPDIFAPGKVEMVVWSDKGSWRGMTWAKTREGVKVEYLGEALEGTPVRVITASFNAG